MRRIQHWYVVFSDGRRLVDFVLVYAPFSESKTVERSSDKDEIKPEARTITMKSNRRLNRRRTFEKKFSKNGARLRICSRSVKYNCGFINW